MLSRLTCTLPTRSAKNRIGNSKTVKGQKSEELYIGIFRGGEGKLACGRRGGGVLIPTTGQTLWYYVRSACKLRARRTEYKSVFFHTT